jgi:hypothetical protein
MGTDTAQRRLLEALADLQRAGRSLDGEDSLARMATEMRAMAGIPVVATFPHIVTYYVALADLFEAVRDDLTTPNERSQ